MVAPSCQERFEPLPDGALLRDRATGLLWRPAASRAAVVFDEAVAPDPDGAWRLPTVSELMELLCQAGESLPACARQPGNMFWTSSESPSARGNRMRVVVCESGPSFSVTPLERSRTALAWLVACPVRGNAPEEAPLLRGTFTGPPELHTVQSKRTPWE